MLTEEAQYGHIEALLKGIMQGDCILRREVKMKGKENCAINTLITICPIKGEENAIVGASVIIRDITQEKIEEHMREHEDRIFVLIKFCKGCHTDGNGSAILFF